MIKGVDNPYPMWYNKLIKRKEVKVMKVKVRVSYPWVGVPDDVEIIEIDEDYNVDDVATEVASEMVWNRVGVSYEILD